jgi:hypothetical protein
MPVTGLKSNTIYELGLWLMNLCKPTEKCPFPLLPNLNIRLETPEGKIVASIVTGELPRVQSPVWTQASCPVYNSCFNITLMLVMMDNIPSGCGNDFALDDITFRECVKQITQVTTNPKTTPLQNLPLQKRHLLFKSRHQKKLHLRHRRKLRRPGDQTEN